VSVRHLREYQTRTKVRCDGALYRHLPLTGISSPGVADYYQQGQHFTVVEGAVPAGTAGVAVSGARTPGSQWAHLVGRGTHRPVVSDTDRGTWRRLRMIPFPHTFGAGGRRGDRNLRSRLINGTKQQEAVLAWLVDGARQWHDRSLGLPAEPAVVKRATQEWRESTDLVYTFARDCLRAAPGERVEVEALRNVFNE